MDTMVKRVFQIAMVSQAALWGHLFYRIVVGSGPMGTPDKVIAALMLADAALFILLTFLFDKSKWTKILTGVFLAVNLVLSVTDQMGFLDFVVLGLNGICLILFFLVIRRRAIGTSGQ